jgi:hypothetical protein
VRTLPVGKHGQFEMVVSDDDWHFLANWRWTFARSHPGAFRELIYARRGVLVPHPTLGEPVTHRFDLFAHHVVLARMGLPAPPEPGWTADHINRDTLDNRRENLRWASPTFQALNRAGSHPPSPHHAAMLAAALAKLEGAHTLTATSAAVTGVTLAETF